MNSAIQFVSDSHSFTEVLRKVDICPNTRNIKKLREFLISSKIDFSHFNTNGIKPAGKITKICPVCKNSFTVSAIGRQSKQETCSYTCANKHFFGRRRKPKAYTTICFKYHKKECVVCGENLVVEVHHLDGNHNNNNINNLVPLCPTHHQYCHSKHRHIVEEKIAKFVASIDVC